MLREAGNQQVDSGEKTEEEGRLRISRTGHQGKASPETAQARPP